MPWPTMLCVTIGAAHSVIDREYVGMHVRGMTGAVGQYLLEARRPTKISDMLPSVPLGILAVTAIF